MNYNNVDLHVALHERSTEATVVIQVCYIIIRVRLY